VHQVSYVGERLQRDLCAVEGAAARSAARLQLLGATLLALGIRLVGIPGTARFVEDALDRSR